MPSSDQIVHGMLTVRPCAAAPIARGPEAFPSAIFMMPSYERPVGPLTGGTVSAWHVADRRSWLGRC